MEVKVHGKHMRVPESVKEFAVEKLGNLERFLSTIQVVDVELSNHTHHRKDPAGHRARVTVLTGGPVFRATATGPDHRACVDQAYHRLERSVKEFKRKRSGKPAHLQPKQPLVPAPEEP